MKIKTYDILMKTHQLQDSMNCGALQAVLSPMNISIHTILIEVNKTTNYIFLLYNQSVK